MMTTTAANCYYSSLDRLRIAPAGGALLFSCSHLHEALNVTRGVRHVLRTFF